jgi:hypothetical protein
LLLSRYLLLSYIWLLSRYLLLSHIFVINISVVIRYLLLPDICCYQDICCFQDICYQNIWLLGYLSVHSGPLN